MASLTACVAIAQVLPKPEEAFKDATIGRTYKDSKPGTMRLTKAPAGAPNVLIILIDDAGFGQWGTFGGQVPTSNLDRLAKLGLRYTRFHTTALCSPTRAALLTGRNHHSAGTGVITEIGDAFPGYSGQIPKSTAMFAEVLRHVIDISPTILEAAHLPQPVEVNGVKQKPIEGVSVVYTVGRPTTGPDASGETAPGTRPADHALRRHGKAAGW
jgi:arylsulfatase A-like enzyme